MLRKWMMLAITSVTATALTVGISVAADEDSPLHKLMEQVNAKNLAITKGVRTAVAFKKAQKDVVTSAEDLTALAKKARDMGADAVKKAKDVKDGSTKWNELMDSFASASDNLAKVAAKPSTTQVQAKEAHTAVKKTCTECHNVFRIEEEGF
jgi:cytochrome c556